MYPGLINIKIFNGPLIVYNENVSFWNEPEDEDGYAWFEYIRPGMKHDNILMKYVRKLKPEEL